MKIYEIFMENSNEPHWNVDAYHGTNKDFEEFKIKSYGQLGFHLGSNPNQANKFVELKRKGRIIPAKIKLKNPLYLPDLASWTADIVLLSIQKFYSNDNDLFVMSTKLMKLFRKISADESKTIELKLSNIPKQTSKKQFDKMTYSIRKKEDKIVDEKQSKLLIDSLKKLGYDGIVYENAFEGEGDSYIVFDSNQIRSRFAAFDPNKKDSGILTDEFHEEDHPRAGNSAEELPSEQNTGCPDGHAMH